MRDIRPTQTDGPRPVADGLENLKLDITDKRVYRRSMTPITDMLKEAIRTCGISNKKLQELSGVNRNSIARFMRGSTSLTLAQAEELVEFFGIKLTKGSK